MGVAILVIMTSSQFHSEFMWSWSITVNDKYVTIIHRSHELCLTLR